MIKLEELIAYSEYALILIPLVTAIVFAFKVIIEVHSLSEFDKIFLSKAKKKWYEFVELVIASIIITIAILPISYFINPKSTIAGVTLILSLSSLLICTLILFIMYVIVPFIIKMIEILLHKNKKDYMVYSLKAIRNICVIHFISLLFLLSLVASVYLSNINETFLEGAIISTTIVFFTIFFILLFYNFIIKKEKQNIKQSSYTLSINDVDYYILYSLDTNHLVLSTERYNQDHADKYIYNLTTEKLQCIKYVKKNEK